MKYYVEIKRSLEWNVKFQTINTVENPQEWWTVGWPSIPSSSLSCICVEHDAPYTRGINLERKRGSEIRDTPFRF